LFISGGFDAVLFRIGRNELEIVAFSKREQGIACAPTGMDSTKRGPDTRASLDVRHTGIEIAAAKKNVIEQSGKFLRRPQKRGCQDGACG
jgi:hypothetical protein